MNLIFQGATAGIARDECFICQNLAASSMLYNDQNNDYSKSYTGNLLTGRVELGVQMSRSHRLCKPGCHCSIPNCTFSLVSENTTTM